MKKEKKVGRGPGRPSAGAATPPLEEIMGRGLAAFAAGGFEATSMRDLARALGVSHNFIHDRYGSKEGFWRAVVDHALAEADGVIEEALSQEHGDELARLRMVVRHIAGFSGARPQLQQMLHFEGTRGSGRLLYIYERYLQPFTLRLTPVISGLVRDGVLRPVPWHILFFLLTAPGTAVGNRPLAELLGRPRDEDDSCAELFADLVINALRAPPASSPRAPER